MLSLNSEKHSPPLRLEDYEVSPKSGFLPIHPPSRIALPKSFRQVQNMAALLPKWLTTRQVRQAIAHLPEINIDQESLSNMQLRRAMLMYSYLTHAYIWGESPPVDVLPRNLAVPFGFVA